MSFGHNRFLGNYSIVLGLDNRFLLLSLKYVVAGHAVVTTLLWGFFCIKGKSITGTAFYKQYDILPFFYLDFC